MKREGTLYHTTYRHNMNIYSYEINTTSFLWDKGFDINVQETANGIEGARYISDGTIQYNLWYKGRESRSGYWSREETRVPPPSTKPCLRHNRMAE